MALYHPVSSSVKIIIGTVAATQDSASVGSFASAAYAHAVTLDSTTNKIISFNIEPAGYGNTFIATIVSGI